MRNKIISEIFCSFCDACGITLILLFFADNLLADKASIKSLVSCIFIFILTFRIVKYQFYEKDNNELVNLTTDIASAKNSDPFPNNEIKKQSSIHEAGHAVMSYLCDKPVDEIILDFPQSYTAVDIIPYDIETLKKSILIYYAGKAAEETILHKRVLGSLPPGQKSDLRKAKDYLLKYIMITDQSVSKAYMACETENEMIRLSNEFYQECMNLMKNNEQFIKTVSEQLYEKSKLTKQEFLKIAEKFNVQKYT